MGFINLLFSVSGRINRAKWWLVVVFWSVISIVVLGAMIVTFAQDILAMDSDLTSEEAVKLILNWGFAGLLFFLLFVLPMLVSSIFAGIKRLHDRDKSGWWLLLFYFGPGLVQSIGGSFPSAGITFVFAVAGFAIAVWGLIELGFLRGTPGPNRFGPDPLASEQTTLRTA